MKKTVTFRVAVFVFGCLSTLGSVKKAGDRQKVGSAWRERSLVVFAFENHVEKDGFSLVFSRSTEIGF